MKRMKKIAVVACLVLFIAGCSFPILYPDLSYAAAFYGKLKLESSVIIRDLDRFSVDDQRDPLETLQASGSGTLLTYILVPDPWNDQALEIFAADGRLAELQTSSLNPLVIDYTWQQFDNKKAEWFDSGAGIFPDWWIDGVSIDRDRFDDLRFTDIHPLENGSGRGLLVLRNTDDDRVFELIAMAPTQIDTVPIGPDILNDTFQPLRPTIRVPFWAFSDPLGGPTGEDPFTRFDAEYPAEAFVDYDPPSTGRTYDFLGMDSDSPESSYFTYLFRFRDTGIIYEAVGTLNAGNFDFSTPNLVDIDGSTSDGSAPATAVIDEFLATRVTFPDGLFSGPSPRYSAFGDLHSVRNGSLRRSYLSVIDLEAADFAAFGWTSGTDQSPTGVIANGTASLVADNRGQIYGRLLTILHDGTLVFQESFGNTLILYREEDARRKRFNPGEIRFQREYRDVNTGEYRISFTAIYPSPYYVGESGDESVTLQSDNYSISTTEFLKLAGY
jgi:hypothetical protein